MLVVSIKLIEYRLSKYYGQVIPDTSSNGMHAVNGIYSIPDSNDCLFSDRGLYFSHANSALRLPPNNQIGTLHRISAPYTIIMWINNFNTEGTYFNRWMNEQYLVIKSNGPNTIGIAYKTYILEYANYVSISGYSGI